MFYLKLGKLNGRAGKRISTGKLILFCYFTLVCWCCWARLGGRGGGRGREPRRTMRLLYVALPSLIASSYVAHFEWSTWVRSSCLYLREVCEYEQWPWLCRHKTSNSAPPVTQVRQTQNHQRHPDFNYTETEQTQNYKLTWLCWLCTYGRL